MGTTFLPCIKEHEINIDQSLLYCTSSKLREYYSSYKSICESFSITISEFIQIFGPNQKSFLVFDVKKKGKIDAIQMFTALIIFSSISYQQKIKFLFQIFDFNQQGYLTYQGLVFLLTNVCNSTYKVYSISRSIHSKQIQEFLNQYFYQQSQVKLEKFIKWSKRIQQFRQYFNFIEQDFQPYFQIKKIERFSEPQRLYKCIEYKSKRNLLSEKQLNGELLGYAQSQGLYGEDRHSNSINYQQQSQNFEIYNQNHEIKNQQNNFEIRRSGNKQQTVIQKSQLKDKQKKKQKLKLSLGNTNNNIKVYNKNKKNSIQNKKPPHTSNIPSHLSPLQSSPLNTSKLKTKHKYNINNFQFDKKFIQSLQQIITPYQQRTKIKKNKQLLQNGYNNINKISGSQYEYKQQDYEQEYSQSDDDNSEEENKQKQIFNPGLHWIYGINTEIREPLKYLNVGVQGDSVMVENSNHGNNNHRQNKNINYQQQYPQSTPHCKASDQLFIYSLNNIIILFYPKINIQKYYLNHKNSISCFQISMNRKLIASADYNQQQINTILPQIHIWDINKRNIIVKYTKIQKGKIHKLKWIKNDRYLLSISSISIMYGGMIKYSIIVIDVLNDKIVLSTYLKVKSDGNNSQIDVIQCNGNIMMTKLPNNNHKNDNNIKNDKDYILIYTANTITHITTKQSPTSSNPSNPNNPNIYMNQVHLLNSNSKISPSSTGLFQQQFSLLSKQVSNVPSIIQIIQNKQTNKLISIHNDNKIRQWQDKIMENGQVIYSRKPQDKQIIKCIYYVANSQAAGIGNTGNNHNLKNNNINVNNKGNSNTYNNLNMGNSTTQNIQKQSKVTSYLLILDEQKIEIFNMKTLKSQKFFIPQDLYNLMLIDFILIGEKNDQFKQLIVVSLFGDVIRVQGFGRKYLSTGSNDNNINSMNHTRINSLANGKYINTQLNNINNNANNNYNNSMIFHQSLSPYNNNNSNPKSLPIISFKKHHQLFRLFNCNSYYSHQQCCFILSSKLLYKINTDQQQLSLLKMFQHQIISISGYGQYYAILTSNQSKYIYILFQDQIIQKIKLLNNINTICMNQRYLIIGTEKGIQIFIKSEVNGKYFTQESKKTALDNHVPIGIWETGESEGRYGMPGSGGRATNMMMANNNTLMNSNNMYRYIITTQQKQLYYLQIKNNQFKYKKIKPQSPVPTIINNNNSNNNNITNVNGNVINNNNENNTNVSNFNNNNNNDNQNDSNINNSYNENNNSNINNNNNNNPNNITNNAITNNNNNNGSKINNGNINSINIGGNIIGFNNNVNPNNNTINTNNTLLQNYIQLIYPNQLSNFPFIFYPNQKFICLALSNGQIRVWNYIHQLKDNQASINAGNNNINNIITGGGTNNISMVNNNTNTIPNVGHYNNNIPMNINVNINNFNNPNSNPTQYHQMIRHQGSVKCIKLRFYQDQLQLITLGYDDSMVLVYSHKQYLIADCDRKNKYKIKKELGTNGGQNVLNTNLGNNNMTVSIKNNINNTNNNCKISSSLSPNNINMKDSSGNTMSNSNPYNIPFPYHQSLSHYLNLYRQQILQHSFPLPFSSPQSLTSLSKLKDSQLLISLNQQMLPAWIKKIMGKIIHPTSNNYQSLSSQSPQNETKLKSNLINLDIEYVYGFTAQRVRNSIGYVHHYQYGNGMYGGKQGSNEGLRNRDRYENRIVDYLEDNIMVSQNISNVINFSTSFFPHNNISYSQTTLLPLNQQHEICKRQIIYFTDNKIILLNPVIKKQRIYTFHKNKVTGFQVHPNKKYICSAETTSVNVKDQIKKRNNSSNLGPVVHVWNAHNLIPLKILKCKHKAAIFKIQFSRMGQYVLTLAGYPNYMNNRNDINLNKEYQNYQNNSMNNNSNNTFIGNNTLNGPNSIYVSIQVSYISQFLSYLQIIQWQYSNSLLYRILLTQQILTLKFNPYNAKQICLAGYKTLKLYQFQQNNLILKQTVHEIQQVITALIYTSALYGKVIESDVIIGTIEGFIGLYICGKIYRNEQEIFKYKTILLTGGEDSCVKIWDTKFNLLSAINIKDQLFIGKQQFNKINYSAQSIDFYSCYPQKFSQASNTYLFLISTRSGHILQAKISSQYQGLKLIQQQKISSIKQKLSLQIRLINSNNFCDNQIQFQVCNQNYMLTYCYTSPLIYLWNYSKKQLLKPQKLRSIPSIIKYDQYSQRIYIGYYKVSYIQIYKIIDDCIVFQQDFMIKSDYYPDNIVISSCFYNNLVNIGNTNGSNMTNNINGNGFYIAISLVSINSQQQGLDMNINLSSINNNSINTATMMSNLNINNPYLNSIQIYQCKDVYIQNNNQSLLMTGNMKNSSYQQHSSNNSQFIQKSSNSQFKSHRQYQLKYHIQRKKACYCFWMQFSSSSQQLLVLYNQKRSRQFEGTLSHDMSQKYTKGCEYILYNIQEKKQKQYSRQDFIQLDFSPFIKISYMCYQKMKINKSNQNNQINANQLGEQNLHSIPTKMAQYKKYNIFGTSSGQLYFVHSDFFCPTHHKIYGENILCKYFKISTTPITKIVIKGDNILLTSARNNSIIYLNIKNFQTESDAKIKDDFNQKITEEFLEKYNKNIYPKRRYIYQSRVNFSQNGRILPKNQASDDDQDQRDPYKKNSQINNQRISSTNQRSSLLQQKLKNPNNPKKRIDLQLYCVIGRNALYKRNNIFVDLKQNIISHTGCNLIILKRNKQQQKSKKDKQHCQMQEQPKYSQQFLKLDSSSFSTFAQISTIVMSEDRRILYAGTNQENAKILVWDISTKTNFKQLSLKGIMSIRKINVSEKKQHIAVIGMDTKGQIILLFISLIQEEILAAYAFKTVDQNINDLIFIPSKQFTFILCGNNYMTEWNYNGLLSFQHYNMQNPADFIQMTQKNTHNNVNKQAKKNKVIFYSIVFLKDILITAGSDGYLYLWNDRKITKKQHAHPKAAILCLYSSKNSKILVSGGTDGKAIVWKLTSSSIIQNIYEFSIYYQQSQIKKQIPIRYHIQSVCINKNNVIVGSRAGQIYEFLCGQQQEIEKLKQQWKKGKNLILPSYDDDIINSCSFNTSSEKLFLITQMGYFSVFNLKTMEKIKQEKIDIGKSQIIKMITCKFSPKIFIILKNSIFVYYYIYNKQEKVQKFRKGKQLFKPQANSFIKNAIISSNQKYLALLMASAQMDLYSIQLYDLTTNQNTFFKQFKILDHIPTNVQIIDFSTDNDYLICKNTQDQQTIIHLLTHQIVNPSTIQFQLQWSDQAKKTSKNIRDILALYGQENQLLKIVQVMNHSIIATDQMGSVRVFEYPVMGVKDQLMFYRFYVEHLNQVYLCVLSQDSRLLATVGKEDKSLLLWKIKEAQEQFKS